MDIESFKDSIKKYRYMCLGSDSTCNIYTSLRNISSDIGVDFTTISKKIRSNDNKSCFCTNKTNGTHYHILLFR